MKRGWFDAPAIEVGLATDTAAGWLGVPGTVTADELGLSCHDILPLPSGVSGTLWSRDEFWAEIKNVCIQ